MSELIDYICYSRDKMHCLCPRGLKVAFIRRTVSDCYLLVTDLKEREEHLLSRSAENMLRIFWIGSDELVCLRRFSSQCSLVVYSVSRGEEKEVIRVRNLSIAGWNASTRKLIVSALHDDALFPDLLMVSVDTGETETLERNDGTVVQWFLDRSSKVSGLLRKRVSGVSSLFARSSELERELVCARFPDSVIPLSVNEHSAIILANTQTETMAVLRIDTHDSPNVEILAEDSRYDIHGVEFGRNGVLNAAVLWGKKLSRIFFCSDYKAMILKIHESICSDQISILGRSGNVVLVKDGFPKSRGSVFAFNERSGRSVAVWVPEIGASKTAVVEPISFLARDGLNIEGYISFSSSSKVRGTLIRVHSGPWVRSCYGFDAETNYLCSLGFNVVETNYRGSTGYGKSHWRAGFRQWGLKMDDDLIDTAHWLISQGHAEGGKIAVYGGSYGGYASLMAVIRSPSLYRCAISIAPVTDLSTWYRNMPAEWVQYSNQISEMVCDMHGGQESLQEISPLYRVEEIHVPILIIHGSRDREVPVSESEQLVLRLRELGKPFEYVRLDGEGHGFKKLDVASFVAQKMSNFLLSNFRD